LHAKSANRHALEPVCNLDVRIAPVVAEREEVGALVLWVDDPVFGDARGFVFGELLDTVCDRTSGLTTSTTRSGGPSRWLNCARSALE
jgi:hypothetical protein